MSIGLRQDSCLNHEDRSKVIAFLRFPLIVGIVLIHANLTGKQAEQATIYPLVSHLFSEIIGSAMVPLFFFISGFLFFYKVSRFTSGVYAQKLRRRLKSLLIPYLFWNVLCLLLFFLAQQLLGPASGNHQLMKSCTWQNWFWAFWDITRITPGDMLQAPVCIQMWYIRDLLVLSLLTPFIYIIVRYARLYFLLPLSAIWLFSWWHFPYPGFSIMGFLFFSFGAYCSIHRRDFTSMAAHIFPVAAVLYAAVVVASYFEWTALYPTPCYELVCQHRRNVHPRHRVNSRERMESPDAGHVVSKQFLYIRLSLHGSSSCDKNVDKTVSASNGHRFVECLFHQSGNCYRSRHFSLLADEKIYASFHLSHHRREIENYQE